MKQINNLTDDARQITHFVLDDGNIIDITFTYLATIQHWQIDIIHSKLTLYGQLLSSNFNLLRQYKNILNFGIACITSDGTEPVLQNDFISGRVAIYILDEIDVQTIEQGILSL